MVWPNSPTVKPCRKVRNLRWDKSDLTSDHYYSGMLLNRIEYSSLCGVSSNSSNNCTSADHHTDIEICFEEIIHCLNEATRAYIPCIPQSALKHYWSVALDELKQDSRSAHEVWVPAEKPQCGSIFEMKKMPIINTNWQLKMLPEYLKVSSQMTFWNYICKRI